MGAAGQFQAAQEFGHSGDFVAFLRGAKLPEHEPVAHRPPRRRRGLAGAGGRASRADQMHGAAARSAAAAQGLAIDGDDLAGQHLAQALGPGGEGLGELRGIEQGEDAPESVVAGDAVGQCEQAARTTRAGLYRTPPSSQSLPHPSVARRWK